MGNYAILKVGNQELRGMKYDIPYTWCLIFDGQKPRKGIYTIDTSSVKTKLNSAGLTLESVEKHLHLLTQIPSEDWQKYREYSLNEDEDALMSTLTEQGYDVDDYEAYPPNTIQELELWNY